jgi:hypothetical protein
MSATGDNVQLPLEQHVASLGELCHAMSVRLDALEETLRAHGWTTTHYNARSQAPSEPSPPIDMSEADLS